LVDADDHAGGVRAVGAVAASFQKAVTAFRDAVSHVQAAQQHLHRLQADTTTVVEAAARQRMLALHLDELASELTPGWLGCRFDSGADDRPLGVDATSDQPVYVRLGDAYPVDDTGFSVVVPFLGTGHLIRQRQIEIID
jgi:DNA segregation ATPase FtsK/SpoIIIE, S-DNA-T family